MTFPRSQKRSAPNEFRELQSNPVGDLYVAGRVYNPDTLAWEDERPGRYEINNSQLYIAVDELEALLTAIRGDLETLAIIDSGNSTATPLGAGGVFTGAAFDALGYASGMLYVYADQASATNGIAIEASTDGTAWDHAHVYSLAAGGSVGIEFSLEARYYRIKYTNGSTAQGAFRLQTKLSKLPSSPHTHGVEYQITGNHPAAIVRSVLTAKKPNGTYTNIDCTAGGNLKAALEEIEAGVVMPSKDIIDDLETLADITGDGTVKNLTFSQQVHLLMLYSAGGVSRVVTRAGETPSASRGIVCDDGVTAYIPVKATTYKVYIPTGAVVSAAGALYA